MLSLLHSKDENNDGEEELSYQYEWDYDENNQLSRRYVSHNNELSINMFVEETWLNSYDETGNILTQIYTKDKDLDGILDVEQEYNWQYDSEGVINSELRIDQMADTEEYRKWEKKNDLHLLTEYYYKTDDVLNDELITFCIE